MRYGIPWLYLLIHALPVRHFDLQNIFPNISILHSASEQCFQYRASCTFRKEENLMLLYSWQETIWILYSHIKYLAIRIQLVIGHCRSASLTVVVSVGRASHTKWLSSSCRHIRYRYAMIEIGKIYRKVNRYMWLTVSTNNVTASAKSEPISAA